MNIFRNFETINKKKSSVQNIRHIILGFVGVIILTVLGTGFFSHISTSFWKDIQGLGRCQEKLQYIHGEIGEWQGQEKMVSKIRGFMNNLKYSKDTPLKETISQELTQREIQLIKTELTTLDDGKIKILAKGYVPLEKMYEFIENLDRSPRIWEVTKMRIYPREDIAGCVVNFSTGNGKKISPDDRRVITERAKADTLIGCELEFLTIAD